jgi:hypothetical protein
LIEDSGTISQPYFDLARSRAALGRILSSPHPFAADYDDQQTVYQAAVVLGWLRRVSFAPEFR